MHEFFGEPGDFARGARRDRITGRPGDGAVPRTIELERSIVLRPPESTQLI
ncbi:hypothetical protein I547_2746 [Mycobacterium kansasii 824]|uniref:Uncharacterized protein n=1 Tax=Mycobacterium kansasii TaxID=1768 RepID=A0A1V3X9X3_MYCKA|nr:hypothetical protein I547_2746 [Mycobacterium kansasii 824]OOK76005.1 hypothetical protein BZL30_3900 [Mycobacterium kansasii]